MRDSVEEYWNTLATMLEQLPRRAVARFAEILFECYQREGTIFVVGNGGSASTASHFACDLAKGTQVESIRAFRVIPLTDNSALLSAWANDTSFERVFAEQLATLVQPGDVVVAISTSGNSPNILAAARVARGAGAAVVALTGQRGGKLRRLSDYTIRVPIGPIEQVEDFHLAIAHCACVALRHRLRQVGSGDAVETNVMQAPLVAEPVNGSVALKVRR